MGVLFRFHLPDALVAQYPHFVETGTGLGVSLSFAAEHPFRTLTSIEYDERLVANARLQFADDHRIGIVQGSSAQLLAPQITNYPYHWHDTQPHPGFLFWLDAHWPGSDYFGKPYEVGDDPQLSLPLAYELQAIADTWEIHQGNFIAIIDDVSSMMLLQQGAAYLFHIFAATHDTVVYSKDEGYAVIAPKGAGPRPTAIERYDIHQLVSASRRYIEHRHWTGARGFAGQIMAMTDGGIDPPDVGTKLVARGEACRYFAADAVANRNPGAASDLFIHAIQSDPECLDYRMDYIYQVLLPVGWRELALSQAKQATKIFPSDPRAWIALAEANRRLGHKDAARAAIAQADGFDHRANGKTDLMAAAIAADAADFAESAKRYNIVMERFSRHRGEALVGLGVTQARAGLFTPAASTFDNAILSDPPDMALALWNRAENLLTLGRYAEGWPDHGRRFELEYKTPLIGIANSRWRRPRWTRDMPPCKVLVQSEQGFGDVICMARYVPMLAALGHDVQFEVDPKLLDLFRYNFPNIKVIPRAPDYPGWLGIEAFDAHLPMMCFPAEFGTSIDTVPWNGSYLKAIPEMVALHEPKHLPRIGLCWSSGRRDGIWEDEYCNRKSVPWAAVSTLIGPICDWAEWRLFDFPADRMVPDDSGPTFADTAATLATCDLLITCDTGIAHLAGAMGTPVWLMMHVGGSWHWMAPEADGGRWAEKSPWYPSVRLFRQERAHEWHGVIDRVSAELRGHFT